METSIFDTFWISVISSTSRKTCTWLMYRVTPYLRLTGASDFSPNALDEKERMSLATAYKGWLLTDCNLIVSTPDTLVTCVTSACWPTMLALELRTRSLTRAYPEVAEVR